MKQTLALAFFFVTAYAQSQSLRGTSSPYSIYGLGEPVQSQSTVMASMGHANLAVVSPININTANPASYAAITRPAFNMDFKNEVLSLSQGTVSQTSSAFSIKNFSFAFPIINDYKKYKRRAGLSFGIMPMTSSGYDIASTGNGAGLGNTDYLFFGGGSINTAFAGLGTDLYANKKRTTVVTAGANAHYVFGHLERHRVTQIEPQAGASNLYRQSFLEMSGVDFSAGLLLKRVDTLCVNRSHADGSTYKDDVPVMFSVGAFVRPQGHIATTVSYYGFTFSDSVMRANPIDTLQRYKDRYMTTMPLSFGVGMSVNIGNQWTLAADYVQTQWSGMLENGAKSALFNGLRVSFGAEFLPKLDIKDADGNYLKTVRYRAGFSAELSPYNMGGTQPLRYGLGLGLGFPLTGASLSNSMFNIGVEAARRQTAGFPLTENYLNIHAGVVITPHVYDQWFAKRKYD